MNYLILECHRAYAVALDRDGRFLRVANLGYVEGQSVAEVIPERAAENAGILRFIRTARPLVAAACLCIILFGAWELVLSTFGTVRMQINPDVLISVNRIDRVVGLLGLNEDGEALISGMSALGRTVDAVSDELADRAVEMGYLDGGGEITLTVDSKDARWRAATEQRLITEIAVRAGETVTVSAGHYDDDEDNNSNDHGSEADAAAGTALPAALTESGSEAAERDDRKEPHDHSYDDDPIEPPYEDDSPDDGSDDDDLRDDDSDDDDLRDDDSDDDDPRDDYPRDDDSDDDDSDDDSDDDDDTQDNDDE